jgi:hypothetical protein
MVSSAEAPRFGIAMLAVAIGFSPVSRSTLLRSAPC